MSDPAPPRHDPELLEIVAGLQAAAPGPHPEPAELLDYQHGALDDATADAVQEHLAACPACTGVLLDLASFEGGEAEGDETGATDDTGSVTDFGTAAAWRALAPELPGHDATPAPRRRTATAPWLSRIAATVLLVVAVALFVQVLRLSDRLDRLATPQTDVPVAYLDAVTRSEGEGATALTLPPEGMVLLVVAPEDPEAFDRYRLEVEGTAGGTLTLDGLRPTADYGTLRVALPAATLEPGTATVRLYGGAPGEDHLLATYPLELTAAP